MAIDLSSPQILRIQQLRERLNHVHAAIDSDRARKLVLRDWREEVVLRMRLIDLNFRRAEVERALKTAQAEYFAKDSEAK